MLVYSAPPSHQRLAANVIKGLKEVVTQEPWLAPLNVWLQHVSRGDVPYVPWLLYALALRTCQFI